MVPSQSDWKPRPDQRKLAEESGEERRRRDPQPMSDVMPRLMAKKGYSRLLSHDDYSDAWLSAAKSLAAFGRPGRLRKGVLEIVVGDSSALQELTFNQRRLLRAMQQQLPDHPISKLKFVVRND